MAGLGGEALQAVLDVEAGLGVGLARQHLGLLALELLDLDLEGAEAFGGLSRLGLIAAEISGVGLDLPLQELLLLQQR